jgi:hypothetical protein
VVLTPSRRQGRRREAGSGGSPRQDLCTEEHEPRMRRGGLGESARYDEARHRQWGHCVNAAGIQGQQSFLPGEICSGVGSSDGVVVGVLTVCVVRRGLTGQKSAEVVVPGQGMCVVGLGRTEREVERPSWCCSWRSR